MKEKNESLPISIKRQHGVRCYLFYELICEANLNTFDEHHIGKKIHGKSLPFTTIEVDTIVWQTLKCDKDFF